jgi:N utilization substance protein A
MAFNHGLNETEKQFSNTNTMPQSIKLTTDQMRLMSLFQNITKATARDCVEDEKQDKIIFVVQEGKMGLAIGKGGSNIKSLQNIIKRNVELVEYFDDPIKFLKNVLNPKLVNEVKLDTKPDGSSQATIIVDHGKKGLVVGREGRNAERARLFAKKYFNISSVLINSPTVTQLEM